MILADTHVHIHGCYDLGKFLDAAFSNFRHAAAQSGNGTDFTAALLLTEAWADNWFERLAGRADNPLSAAEVNISKWSFRRTCERGCIIARSDPRKELLIISGRQIATGEGLEVLALFTAEVSNDGSPIGDVIDSVKAAGGLPVIPWGFGKWSGRRGALLDRLMRDGGASRFLLGDNANRPAFLPTPAHFDLAARLGMPVLPGSDPLPFASELERAGSYGLSVWGTLSRDYPARDLKRILSDPQTRFAAYGNLEQPWRFFRNQLAAQAVKLNRRNKSR